MVLSEMQIAFLLSATSKDPNPASKNSDYGELNGENQGSSIREVLENSGTSQDEEDQEEASRIEVQYHLKTGFPHHLTL